MFFWVPSLFQNSLSFNFFYIYESNDVAKDLENDVFD